VHGEAAAFLILIATGLARQKRSDLLLPHGSNVDDVDVRVGSSDATNHLDPTVPFVASGKRRSMSSDSDIHDEIGFDNPRSDAPRWAGRSQPGSQSSILNDAPSMVPGIANSPPTALATAGKPLVALPISVPTPTTSKVTDSPPMAPGIGGPNIELPPRLRSFEGDLALRRRLVPSPDFVPPPPLQLEEERFVIPWFRLLSLIVIVAAAVVFAQTSLPLRGVRNGGIAGLVVPVLDGFSHSPVRQTGLLLSQRSFTNEPIRLGVSLKDGVGGELVTLVGLVKGTKITAGAPLGLTGWQMLARDLDKAFAWAPKNFVGVMNAAIDLRSPRDQVMDRQIIRLEWIPKKQTRLVSRLDPPQLAPANVSSGRSLGSEDLAMLIRRAEEFFKNGDVVSARIALRRGATAGDAQALLAMGATFDPKYLDENGVLGFAADVAEARAWYGRAAQLGSTEARRRLQHLNLDDKTQ
jgi:hypothetical protein